MANGAKNKAIVLSAAERLLLIELVRLGLYGCGLDEETRSRDELVPHVAMVHAISGSVHRALASKLTASAGDGDALNAEVLEEAQVGLPTIDVERLERWEKKLRADLAKLEGEEE